MNINSNNDNRYRYIALISNPGNGGKRTQQSTSNTLALAKLLYSAETFKALLPIYAHLLPP